MRVRNEKRRQGSYIKAGEMRGIATAVARVELVETVTDL
jgi:hypothetical protein